MRVAVFPDEPRVEISTISSSLTKVASGLVAYTSNNLNHKTYHTRSSLGFRGAEAWGSVAKNNLKVIDALPQYLSRVIDSPSSLAS